jgi:outer membrane protein TolC
MNDALWTVDVDEALRELDKKIERLEAANANLVKLAESLMLYEDEFYDEAKKLLSALTG